MATRTPATKSKVLTYEQYMTEEAVHKRYDIIDGVRVYMAGPRWNTHFDAKAASKWGPYPTRWLHQRIQGKTTRILDGYEEKTGTGYVIPAPFDILIRRRPRLQTRQPDVLFITRARLDQGGGIPTAGPLEVPPELVVEIISDSETERRLGAKLADYVFIGVNEAWLLRPGGRTADVLRLAPDGPVTVATYDATQTLHSITFPDLIVPVADFFRV